jgi:hypothetical protein
MKKWNQLMLTVAAISVSLSLSAQTHGQFCVSASAENIALLASPRYREEHPEVVRLGPSCVESAEQVAPQLAVITMNTALANSPRFKEEHPELLRTGTASVDSSALEAKHLVELLKNAALVRSPRFKEVHAELRWAVSPTQTGETISATGGARSLAGY